MQFQNLHQQPNAGALSASENTIIVCGLISKTFFYITICEKRRIVIHSSIEVKT